MSPDDDAYRVKYLPIQINGTCRIKCDILEQFAYPISDHRQVEDGLSQRPPGLLESALSTEAINSSLHLDRQAAC
jgi:hypothetical protein